MRSHFSLSKFPPKPFDCSGGLAEFRCFLNKNINGYQYGTMYPWSPGHKNSRETSSKPGAYKQKKQIQGNTKKERWNAETPREPIKKTGA